MPGYPVTPYPPALPDLSQGGGPPGNATAGVASSIAVQAFTGRKKIVFVNDSDTDIYLAKGELARLNAGIRLNAGGGSYEDVRDPFGYIYLGPWAAISSAANKNLCIQEDR